MDNEKLKMRELLRDPREEKAPGLRLRMIILFFFPCQVTLRMFKQRQTQAEQIPLGYQYLSEVCKPYKAGEKYLEFIQALQKKDIHVEAFEFEPLAPGGQR